MAVYKNIKYSYYDSRNGSGPYYDTHMGYNTSQTSYSSIEDMLQKTHPDWTNIRVISYDRE